MTNKIATIYIARNLTQATWCKGVVDKLYETFVLKPSCWIEEVENGYAVHLLGNEFEADLAQAIVEMKEFTHEAMKEISMGNLSD